MGRGSSTSVAVALSFLNKLKSWSRFRLLGGLVGDSAVIAIIPCARVGICMLVGCSNADGERKACGKRPASKSHAIAGLNGHPAGLLFMLFMH